MPTDRRDGGHAEPHEGGQQVYEFDPDYAQVGLWILRYPLKVKAISKVSALIGGHEGPGVWGILDLFQGGGNGIDGVGIEPVISLSRQGEDVHPSSLLQAAHLRSANIVVHPSADKLRPHCRL